MSLKSIIVFEGPDNCGKTTQIPLVQRKLTKKLIDFIITAKFPNYDSMYGKLIKNMLNNKDKYDLRNNLDDMNLFSLLQLEDKLHFMNSINTNNGDNDGAQLIDYYLLLDRYTLSSHIYDGLSRIFYNEWVDDYDNIDNIRKCELKYYNGNCSFKDIKASMKMCKFLQNKIFKTDNVFTSGYGYLKDKIDFGYKMLEHDFFDIKYVYFRSCKAIERITKENRKLDQYEDDQKFTNTIKAIYNLMPDYRNIIQTGLDSTTPSDSSIDKSFIVVDTTRLLSKELCLGTEENGLSEEDEEVMYKYCKANSGIVMGMVANDITDKLYEILKN
jgi:thymidylate kinase